MLTLLKRFLGLPLQVYLKLEVKIVKNMNKIPFSAFYRVLDQEGIPPSGSRGDPIRGSLHP